ncbi:AP2 [Musa troglodytarum]|uniref:AP2 n=1 Tax=Musa troglodytarum TaxID=320322 RepID=A0A9E7JK51_9LILI|nr:AP2 [Musa troglodytarum]
MTTRYKRVTMGKWGSWVAEVRFPNSRERLWLGSYPTVEQAARAYDAAVYCLRDPGSAFSRLYFVRQAGY